jgi:hypothetical protein
VAPSGDALRRRLARGDPCARAGRVDRDDLAAGARRARARARRRGPRRGRARLPLAPPLAVPPLLQDHRVCHRALRVAGTQGAPAAGDRVRRADVLPGVLRAGRGERPRIAVHPRPAPRRSLRRRRSQDLDIERLDSGLDLPRRAHGSRGAAPPRHLRPRCSTRHAGDRGPAIRRARGRLPVRGLPRRSRGRRREPRRRGRTGLGRPHAHPRLRARDRREDRGPLLGARRARAASRGDGAAGGLLAAGCDPPRRARGGSPALPSRGRPPRSRRAGKRRLGDGEALRRPARTASRLGRVEGLRDGDRGAPLEGRLGALARASAGSTISGGAAEIQQLVIARRGLGLR